MIDVVRLLQFGDSALPVGTFSFSGGLETAVQTGVVCDLLSLEQFIETCTEQSATSDGIALLEAFRATRAGDLGHVQRADWACYNRKLNEEMRSMAIRMGRKLAELARHVLGGPLAGEWLEAIGRKDSPGTYAVAHGVVFAELGLSEQEAFAAHQYAVCSMISGAALRLMKVRYLDVQAVMFRVNRRVLADYQRVADAGLDEMSTFAPVFDILSALHVRSHVRMFLS